MLVKAISFICIALCLSYTQTSQAQSERNINAPINGEETLPNESVPNMTIPTGNEPLKQSYSHIDPNHLVPDSILRQAIQYYDVNLDNIANKNYMTIIDFNQHSSQRRLFLVNMRSGAVSQMLTAVGSGSDPDSDGYADVFSNVVDSHMSSLGFYLTSSTYEGGNGYSLRLHGLSTTNSKAFERYIVVHGADYVSESQNKAGRSWGCPAVDRKNHRDLIEKIKGGSIMFMTHSSFQH